MKKPINIQFSHVFFIGIGGTSMSGLAKMVISAGGRVSGSDMTFSDELTKLSDMGAEIYIGHNAKNITENISLVVYSGAIKEDNPEIVRAKEISIPIMERSEFLGLIAREYSHVIAISGTHGKTTTTAMLGHIFECAGYCPTIHLGGVSNNLGTNTLIGDKDYLIVEACEYRESFRFLNPETLIITNIEADHLDYYKDIEDIRKAFVRLSCRSRTLISHDSLKILHPDHVIINEDYVISKCAFSSNAYRYYVEYKGEILGEFTLNTIGYFNVENSLLAIVTALQYGIDINIIKKALSTFTGVERRYQKIKEIGSVPIIIDYAHHPTEISKSIAGIKDVYNNPLIIFQPHTYSRTLKLFDDFVTTLSIDNIVLYATYPAREEEIVGGRAIDLFDAIKVKNKVYCQNVDWLNKHIQNKISGSGCDSVLILGAGDLAIKLKKILNEK